MLTLSSFFVSSLSSVPCSDALLVPATTGLSVLFSAKNSGRVLPDTLAEVLAALWTLDLIGRPQNTRWTLYNLLDTLLANHRRLIVERHAETFTQGYCKLITGEKDPRNLKLLFSLTLVILLDFPNSTVSANIQSLYDVTFCYFPITFTPPKNDPYGISSEELQVDLRKCMTAHHRFGPLALPIMLEKLKAATKTSKNQAMLALKEGLPVYGRPLILAEGYDKQLWDVLDLEVRCSNPISGQS